MRWERARAQKPKLNLITLLQLMRMPRLLVHDEFYEQMYLYKLFRHRQDSYLILSVKDSRGELTRKGAKSVSSPSCEAGLSVPCTDFERHEWRE